MSAVAKHANLIACHATFDAKSVPRPESPVYLWLIRIDNRTGERPPSHLQIPIDLLRPHPHQLGSIVELIRLDWVLWQVLDHIQLKPKQVSQRMFVFDIRQPARCRFGVHCSRLLHVVAHPRLDPLHHRLRLGGIGLWLIGRRHLAVLQHLQNRLPLLQLLPQGEVAAQRVQCDLALGLRGAVAAHAVLLKERPDNTFVTLDPLGRFAGNLVGFSGFGGVAAKPHRQAQDSTDSCDRRDQDQGVWFDQHVPTGQGLIAMNQQTWKIRVVRLLSLRPVYLTTRPDVEPFTKASISDRVL